MAKSDFTFEFHAEVPDVDHQLEKEAEGHLRKLAARHADLVGVSVALEPVAQSLKAAVFRYQARVVAYIRPTPLAATEQANTPAGALKGALVALARQVREHREKLREPWK